MKRRKLLKRGLPVLGLAGLGLLAVVDRHIGAVGGEGLVGAAEAPAAEAILILGAGVWPGGVPSPMLADRLEKGLELFRAGRAPRILVSGDHGRPDYDEVNPMRRYLVDRGVPPAAVLMDPAGFSTFESLHRAREVFAVRRLLVVSQDYHLRRAIYLARELGLEAYGVAADVRPYAGALGRRLREVAARAKAFFEALGVTPTNRK